MKRHTTLPTSVQHILGGVESAAQLLVLEDFPRPEVARALSPNGRSPWPVKRKARLSVVDHVTVAALKQHLRHMHGAVVIWPTWTFPIARRRDGDNLTATLKAVQDCLVRGGWLAEDDVTHVAQMPPAVRIEKGRRSLELRFEEVPIEINREVPTTSAFAPAESGLTP